MRAHGVAAVIWLLIGLAGCTAGNGEDESPATGANRTACESLASPDKSSNKALAGFARVNADGVPTTTGGAGGTVHSISSFDALVGVLDNGDNDAPKIIEISGIVSGSGMISVGSNTTILGVGNEPTISGFGFNMSNEQNIIIANLYLTNGGNNALRLSDGTHHVWVHHNDFSFYKDNAIEIREGASYATIDWNRFHNQNKVVLTGHSDHNAGQDVGRLKVTLHHNWFDATTQRHPLVRFGEVHVFNNFYDDVDLYGVGSTLEADVLVQANFFGSVPKPISRGPTVMGTLDEGDVVECDNVYVDSGNPEVRGSAFDPAAFYSYTLNDAEDVPDIVVAGAGPRFIAPSDDPLPIDDPRPVVDPPPVDEPPPVDDPPMDDPPPVDEPPPVDDPDPPPVDEPPPVDDPPPTDDPPQDNPPGGPGPGGPRDKKDD
jgi:pectate lyase